MIGRPRESGAYTSKTFRNIAQLGEVKGEALPTLPQTQLFGRPRESGAYTSKTFRNIAHFGEVKGEALPTPPNSAFPTMHFSCVFPV